MAPSTIHLAKKLASSSELSGSLGVSTKTSSCTEFKFPEYCEEESYEEMKNRLLCEVKGCEHCEAYRYFEMAFDKFFEW